MSSFSHIKYKTEQTLNRLLNTKDYFSSEYAHPFIAKDLWGQPDVRVFAKGLYGPLGDDGKTQEQLTSELYSIQIDFSSVTSQDITLIRAERNLEGNKEVKSFITRPQRVREVIKDLEVLGYKTKIVKLDDLKKKYGDRYGHLEKLFLQ